MEGINGREIADRIRRSEEYQTVAKMRDVVFSDKIYAELVGEYLDMSERLAMSVMTQQEMPEEDKRRFEAMNVLLYSNPTLEAYLLSLLRLKQEAAEIAKTVMAPVLELERAAGGQTGMEGEEEKA